MDSGVDVSSTQKDYGQIVEPSVPMYKEGREQSFYRLADNNLLDKTEDGTYQLVN